jgi:hypothetical protein
VDKHQQNPSASPHRVVAQVDKHQQNPSASLSSLHHKSVLSLDILALVAEAMPRIASTTQAQAEPMPVNSANKRKKTQQKLPSVKVGGVRARGVSTKSTKSEANPRLIETTANSAKKPRKSAVIARPKKLRNDKPGNEKERSPGEGVQPDSGICCTCGFRVVLSIHNHTVLADGGVLCEDCS